MASLPPRILACVAALACFVVVFFYERSAREAFAVPKKAWGAALICGLACVSWISRRGCRAIPLVPALALLALSAVGVATAAMATSPAVAIEGIRDLVLLAIPAWVVGAVVLRSARRVGIVLEACGWAACGVALIGLVQQQQLDWWGYVPWPPRAPGAAAPGAAGPPTPDVLGWGPVSAVIRAVYDALASLARADLSYETFGPLAPVARWLHRECLLGRWFSRLPTRDGFASVFGHPNVAAEVVAAGAAAHLTRLWGGIAATRSTPAALVLGILGATSRLVALLICAAYVLVTGSRGAWVALVVVGALLAAAYVFGVDSIGRRRRLVVALAGLLALAAAGAAMARVEMIGGRGGGARESIADRVEQLIHRPDPARDTVRERLTLWANTRAWLQQVSERSPLDAFLGVGPGNWVVIYPSVSRKAAVHVPGTYTLERYPDHPHQDPLEFVTEYGLVGALLLSLAIGTTWARCRARLRATTTRFASIGILVVLTAVSVTSLFSFPLHGAVPVLWMFMLLGAGAATWTTNDGAPAGEPSGRGAVVALTCTVFAGFVMVATGSVLATSSVIAMGVGCAIASHAWRSGRRTLAWSVALTTVALGAAYAAVGAETRFECLALAVGVAGAVVSATTAGFRDLEAGPGVRRLGAIALAGLTCVALAGGNSRIDQSVDRAIGSDMKWAAQVSPADRDNSLLVSRNVLDTASVLTPADFIAELERGAVLFAAQDLVAAEASLSRCLALHPHLANAYVARANLMYVRGRSDEAFAAARTARQLNPDAYQARSIWGLLMAGRGSRELAAGEFEKAIELAPGNVLPDARIALAQIYLDDNRESARALAHLERAAKETAANPILLRLVAGLYQHPSLPPEFHARGARLWHDALVLDPTDVEARFRIAIEPLRGIGDPPSDEALKVLLKALEDLLPATPSRLQTQVRFYRALCLDRLGRTSEAEKGYRDVIVIGGAIRPHSADDEACLHAAVNAIQAMRASGRQAQSPDSRATSGPAK